jgi:ribose transport system permease protein
MRREFGMFVALLAMCVVLFFFSSNDRSKVAAFSRNQSAFAARDNIVNNIREVSKLSILAIGSSFVIITGGIDLSVGSMVGLVGVLIAYFCAPPEDGGHAWNIYAGIAMSLGIAMLIGLAQGLLITKLGLQPFIVTLGTMLGLRGVSQTIVKGGTIDLADIPFSRLADTSIIPAKWAAQYPHLAPYLTWIQYPTVIFLAVAVISIYLLHFTVFGRYVYAIGGNRDAAAYSGIRVQRVETATYVISAGLAGIAAICYAPYIGQMSQSVGIAYELYAITAAVLGGCSLRGGEGTIIGIIIGTCVMIVIENGIVEFHVKSWNLDTNWTNWILGGTILIAVVIDQIVHIVQAKRRTRRAAQTFAGKAQTQGIYSVTPPSQS